MSTNKETANDPREKEIATDNLKARLDVVEKKLEELRELYLNVKKSTDKQPEAAVMSAGGMVEKILLQICEDNGIRVKRKSGMKQVMQEIWRYQKNHADIIPVGYWRDFEMIRDCRNVVAHPNPRPVKLKAAEDFKRPFKNIIRWFIEEYCGADGLIGEWEINVDEFNYLKALCNTYFDGIVSSEERLILNNMQAKLGITGDRAEELEKKFVIAWEANGKDTKALTFKDMIQVELPPIVEPEEKRKRKPGDFSAKWKKAVPYIAAVAVILAIAGVPVYLTNDDDTPGPPLELGKWQRLDLRDIKRVEKMKILKRLYEVPPGNAEVELLMGKVAQSLYVTNFLKMEFAYIPEGMFMLGSPSGEIKREKSDTDEKSITHFIENGFYMSRTEVTIEQFSKFITETNYETDAEKFGYAKVRTDTIPAWKKVVFRNAGERYIWNNSHLQQDGKHPVVLVTWNDANEFINWLNARDPDKRKYRLPSEAEWEYACQAGVEAPFSTGQTISVRQANFCGYVKYPSGEKRVAAELFKKTTTPAGSYPANRWGLFDMHGNVWEWCHDPYIPVYVSEDVEESERVDQDTSLEYVRRGGGWASSAIDIRSANRWKLPPYYPRQDSGFRVVMLADL